MPMVTNSTEESAVRIRLGSEIANGEFAEIPGQQTDASKLTLWAPIGVVFGLAAVASFYLPIFAGRPEHSTAISGLVAGVHSSTPPTLGLRALRQGDTVLISWDPKAAAASSATEGFLEVWDGMEEKHLRLDAGQISSGLMSYNAHATDLLLRLEFRNHERRVMTQSVTLFGGSGDASQSILKPAAAVGNRVAVTARVDSESGMLSKAEMPDKAASKGKDATASWKTSRPANNAELVASDAATTKKQNKLVNALPPIQIHVTSTNLPLDNAPVLSASMPSLAAQAADAIDRLTPQPALVQPPPPELQPKTATVEAAVVAPPTKFIALDPNAGNYTPPRPLKWSPVSAKKAKISLANPVDIALKIRIDEFGRVTKVRALSEGQRTSKELMKLADDSVRRWTFEPARYKGKAMSSEDTIVLRIEK